MSAEKRFYFIGFYISLGLYGSMLIFLAYMYNQSPDFLQRFTAKDNFLDIILVEKRETITGEDKSSTVTIVNQDSSPASAKTQTVGIQDLFDNIDEKNLTKSGTKASSPSRLDGKNDSQNNASKLLDKLTFKRQSTLTVNSASSGIRDPFIGKIQDILSEKWAETIYTVTGANAQVEITINNSGAFSYSIVFLSYNDDFNDKLKNFLEEMRSEVFPRYEGTGVFKFNTTFKDEME
ncbi:MAG: TonB C-terminal domain-containing protein [Campylobacteraceae bacterium]|jgi:protein TonB|nr:TonB C-terminal domain-containing protein [Campylobacteraceae bacterium]